MADEKCKETQGTHRGGGNNQSDRGMKRSDGSGPHNTGSAGRGRGQRSARRGK